MIAAGIILLTILSVLSLWAEELSTHLWEPWRDDE